MHTLIKHSLENFRVVTTCNSVPFMGTLHVGLFFCSPRFSSLPFLAFLGEEGGYLFLFKLREDKVHLPLTLLIQLFRPSILLACASSVDLKSTKSTVMFLLTGNLFDLTSLTFIFILLLINLIIRFYYNVGSCT